MIDYTVLYTLFYEHRTTLFLILSLIFGSVNLMILCCACSGVHEGALAMIFIIVLVVPIYSYSAGIEYVMHNTDEYIQGYEDFPDNKTYNEILEIETIANTAVWGKNTLEAKEELYKIGWEDHRSDNMIDIKNDKLERLRNDI